MLMSHELCETAAFAVRPVPVVERFSWPSSDRFGRLIFDVAYHSVTKASEPIFTPRLANKTSHKGFKFGAT